VGNVTFWEKLEKLTLKTSQKHEHQYFSALKLSKVSTNNNCIERKKALIKT
jgi:hypothetical protein